MSAPNPFETGSRKVIPAVLVYLRRGNEILMLHRGSRKGDFHEGKWNGLGGKFETGESPLEAARREVEEESGLRFPLEDFRSLGVVQFPNFKPHKNEDWIVFVFTVELKENDTRIPREDCPEGTLHWISEGEILNLNLWPGDELFIPHVLVSQPFIGTIWYQDQKVNRSWIQALGLP